MRLTLDSSDLAGVQRLMHLLLSPLEHPDLDGWRRAVCREAKQLLGADMATFQLPSEESTLFFTEELPQEVIGNYPATVESLDRRFQMWRRKAALGVCSRAMLWGRHLGEYERNAYFHEFVVPARGFDAIILAHALDSGQVSAATVATLMFHHCTPTGPRFGERGLALLRLLQPCFQSGIEAYRRLSRWRDGLGRLLDAVPDGLLLVDHEGRVVHENTALKSMLAQEPEAVQISLSREMEALARGGSALLRGTGTRAGTMVDAPGPRDVRTTRAAYRIRLVVVDEAVLGRERGAVVMLERTTPVAPTTDALRERFGFTRKEAEVALLLARGSSNEEVARELFVSPHTARRHTERILQKMNVRSRSEVAARLY